MRRLLSIMCVAALAALAAPVRAQVPGGGPAKSDCYIEWSGVTPNKGKNLDCQDGDPSCDVDGVQNRVCVLGIGVCLAQTNVPECTPQSVLKATVKPNPKALKIGGVKVPTPVPVTPAVPTTGPVCGDQSIFRLPLKVNNKGKLKPSQTVTLTATAMVSEKPKKDKDVIKVRCVPNTGGGECLANPAGGPRELQLLAAASGTDLDNGWTGASQNFPVVSNSALRVCLTGCGATSESGLHRGRGADERGQRGDVRAAAAAARREHAGLRGEPLRGDEDHGCRREHRHRGDERHGQPALRRLHHEHLAGVSALLGQQSGRGRHVRLRREAGQGVHHRGRRHGGERGGQSALLRCRRTVPRSVARRAPSPSACRCRPARRSCRGRARVPGRQQDAPGTCGACGTVCTGGACVSKAPDGQCVDVKGGISQNCCGNDTSQPCFPTANNGQIVRSGSAAAPTPAFGDPTYPKTGNVTLVATFCEGTAGSSLVDIVTGLPGPGALVLPMAATWMP